MKIMCFTYQTAEQNQSRHTHLYSGRLCMWECANPCAGAWLPQERVLAVGMATHPRLGADSLLGRHFSNELFHDIFRIVAGQLRAK